MNEERRKQLRIWSKKQRGLKDELESILWDEQNSYDNIPENLQNSQRAEDSEEAISQIEEAVENIEEAINLVDEIV